MKKLNLYETIIVGFYLITIASFCSIIYTGQYFWLIPICVWVWINHIFHAFNHRLNAHRSFIPRNEFVRRMIICLSIFQVNNSPLKFAVIHRHHHKHSDEPAKDVHGPHMGLFRTLIGWDFGLTEFAKEKEVKIYKDLLRDEFLVWFDKHYYKIFFTVFGSLLLVSPTWFFYVIAPSVIVWRLQANYFANYLGHKPSLGYRNHNLPDDSANNLVSAVVTAGAGYHNNHHANPGNYYFGEKWFEFDPSGLLIKYFLKK